MSRFSTPTLTFEHNNRYSFLVRVRNINQTMSCIPVQVQVFYLRNYLYINTFVHINKIFKTKRLWKQMVKCADKARVDHFPIIKY